ncbi:hypothetical protein [Paraclostridium sordellii]|uniref:hypothetical protein n=1 Tax=Paraclostridium sordellii TaxID=1505 RepID=UPI0018C2EE3D|nr:hypothetical protein [Paeniclostridium sordellii]
MGIINFIFSQSISFLVNVLSGLSTNYLSDKIKNHSSLPTKSGSELEIKIKFKRFK